MRKIVLFTVIIGSLLAVLPYLVAAWNESPVDDEFRSKAPGQFVQLSDGKVHYRWIGNGDGEIIVLVHGVSVPQYVFVQASDALAVAGYRVLLFDHLGHGFSDRPTARYDADFFARQMLELFDSLELNQPVNIGALSMGGVIAADFTARHPDRVKSLTLFAPAGLRLVNETDSHFVALLKSPVIGHWLWRMLSYRMYFPEVDENTVDPADEPDSDEVLHGDPKLQADYEGYLMAQRQIFRQLPLSHRDDLFAKIGQSKVPLLAIFGSADVTISLESADLLRDLVPQAQVEVLEGGTHHLNIHRWRAVNDIMLAFFGNHSSAAENELRSLSQ